MKYLVFQLPNRAWSWKLVGDDDASLIDCALSYESRKEALDDVVKFRGLLEIAVIEEPRARH